MRVTEGTPRSRSHRAVGVYCFERSAQPEAFASVFHSVWWAVVTLTTVGYGDVYPTTVGGRIFTFFVLMLGLGVVAVPTGLLRLCALGVRSSRLLCKRPESMLEGRGRNASETIANSVSQVRPRAD